MAINEQVQGKGPQLRGVEPVRAAVELVHVTDNCSIQSLQRQRLFRRMVIGCHE